MHILICHHPSVKAVREKCFHSIVSWLLSEHTDPLLLQMIEYFWYGDNYDIESNSEQEYRKIYNIMKEIGVSQMWSEFLPRYMVEL